MEKGKKRANAKGRRMKMQGGGGGRYLGRRKQILGEGGVRCFREGESGREGSETG